MAHRRRRPSFKRTRYSGVKRAHARCHGCAWNTDAAGAMGLAAAHFNETGHTVEVEQTIGVVYTQPGSAYELAAKRGWTR